MKKFLLLTLFSLFIISLAQAQVALGAFKEYLPYNSFKDVAVAKDMVYAATNMSLMLVDKNDELALSTWSKIDGLSEMGISCIEYSKENDLLIIAYNNSNIDIIKDQKLTNVADIKNKQMSGSKTINEITFYGNKAYISCAFGVVVIDLKTYLVEDTWFTTRDNEAYSVKAMVQSDDYFFLSTTKGLFYTPKNSYQLANFSSWEKIEEMGDVEYRSITLFHDKLLVVKEDTRTIISGMPQDTLYVFENGVWEKNLSLPISQYISLDVNGDELLICDRYHFYVLNENMDITSHGIWSEDNTLPIMAKLEEENVWIADEYVGLACYFREHHYARLLTYGGPFSEMTESIDYVDGMLAIVPGTRVGWGISYHRASVSWMKNGTWAYNSTGFEDFDEMHDFNKIVINPNNINEFYIASWGGGLVKMKDGKAVMQYNYRNSPMEATNSLNLLSAMAFDKNGNLWMSNSQDSRPLKKLDKEGNFTSYSLSPYVNASEGVMAEHLLFDSRNQIWVTYPRSSNRPLVVFKEGNGNTASKVAYIDMNSAANISTTTVTAIAEDMNGQIWIGTEQGIKVIYTPSTVFDRQTYAQNILIDQLGTWQNLLAFEQITCIAVDGGNRKWIGTAKAGVFLMSADGTKELLHLTESNSSLFSNQITAIKINPDNGEVYIGTAAGMLSYRGQATGGKEDYSEVLVYPNPVREDYNGDIAVSGLMENSFCKIANASGSLVWHGYAYGGQFIWNGKDYNGNKVATGVYFVFASDSTGKEKSVAKILVIN